MEDHGQPQQPRRAGRAAQQEGGGRPPQPARTSRDKPCHLLSRVLEPSAREAWAASGRVGEGRQQRAGRQRGSSHQRPHGSRPGPRGAATAREPVPRAADKQVRWTRVTLWLRTQRDSCLQGRGAPRLEVRPPVSRPAGALPCHPVAVPENVRATQPAPPSSRPGPREPAARVCGGGWGGVRPHAPLAVTHWPCGASTLSRPSLGQGGASTPAWTASTFWWPGVSPPSVDARLTLRAAGLAHRWQPPRSSRGLRALFVRARPAGPSPCGHVPLGGSPVHG